MIARESPTFATISMFEWKSAVGGKATTVTADAALRTVLGEGNRTQVARLGIDTTVLFRTMLCDYAIADGQLQLERMRVDSDLLSLVGEGAISFEGDVMSDLEVRYGLVDRLGPLTQLLYHIQNSLLRVSIRGSMERPTVVLRGLMSQFFSPDEERERLPLPGFSQRRRRF